jgi:S1-C subfamily serine protease
MIFQRDTLGNVICNIRIPQGTEEVGGTAIFIAKNNEPYLLTAAHVVKNMNAQAYAILSDLNGVPTKVLLSDLLGGASFTNHATADLAKVKINVTATNAPHLIGRCFPYDQIDLTTNPVSKDIELTTIGFPLGLGVVGAKFSPLTYRSYVASPVITLLRSDNQIPSDFIILELPSIGGYSGGPTFDLGYVISGNITSTKQNTKLHGIVHGTISDETGGKLAAITPCKYLMSWL